MGLTGPAFMETAAGSSATNCIGRCWGGGGGGGLLEVEDSKGLSSPRSMAHAPTFFLLILFLKCDWR